MKTIYYSIPEYHAVEQDLCLTHFAGEHDKGIDAEYKDIQSKFRCMFPNIIDDDIEFPEWHHNIRMMWAYLYSDMLYTSEFIPIVQQTLQSMPNPWFAQFECFSPSLETPESPSGFAGHFVVYKDTLIFSESESISIVASKLQAQQSASCNPLPAAEFR